MHRMNNASLIRRELLVRVAKLIWEAELPTKVDRIPSEMIPRNRPSFRCCVHKDRAVLKYRLMAILGFSVEDEEDELVPLADYARAALDRERVERPILTVVDEACSACNRSRYFVTNACRGCFARPCTMNCPKKALAIVGGQAVIDADKCVACGICQQACPYHAIIHIPIPCEETCPVGAITKDEAGRERIDHEKCVLCGRCLRDCPFGAIMEKSEMVDVVQLLREGAPVIALVAPAIVGQFPGTLEQVYGAIREAGFCDIIEVARGAELTATAEAAELIEHEAAGKGFLTTSCCPSWVLTANRHLPEIAGRVSQTPSPMAYTARLAREQKPEAIRVFIGPCLAKKSEGLDDPNIAYVLSFEELGAIFVARDIDTASSEPFRPGFSGNAAARGFAAAGGVTAAVAERVKASGAVMPESCRVDGLSRQNLNLLKGWAKTGNCPGALVEVMACEGGCINGPAVVANPKLTAKALAELNKPKA